MRNETSNNSSPSNAQRPINFEALNEFDELYVKLLSGLARNSLDSISQSANHTLDVACQFFEKDVSKVLVDFQNLYTKNSELDAYKNSINKSVDDLLDRVNNAETGKDAIDEIMEDEARSVERNSLASLQKDLEALVTQDELVKDRLVPVMQGMQYEDIVINQVKRLIECWEYIITLLNLSGDVQYDHALKKIFHKLSTEDEHQNYFKHLLKTTTPDLSDPDKPIPIDDIVKNSNIHSSEELLHHFMSFSSHSLETCIRHTHGSFLELMQLLQTANKEAEHTRYLFSNPEETLKNVMEAISQHEKSEEEAIASQLKNMLSTKEHHDESANQLISALMIAMQSQDRIRQHLENITKVTLTWNEFRNEITSEHKDEKQVMKEYQSEIIDKLTIDSEREIVKALFPDVQIDEQSDSEPDLF